MQQVEAKRAVVRVTMKQQFWPLAIFALHSTHAHTRIYTNIGSAFILKSGLRF